MFYHEKPRVPKQYERERHQEVREKYQHSSRPKPQPIYRNHKAKVDSPKTGMLCVHGGVIIWDFSDQTSKRGCSTQCCSSATGEN